LDTPALGGTVRHAKRTNAAMVVNGFQEDILCQHCVNLFLDLCGSLVSHTQRLDVLDGFVTADKTGHGQALGLLELVEAMCELVIGQETQLIVHELTQNLNELVLGLNQLNTLQGL
jgi:hypothetical protein